MANVFKNAQVPITTMVQVPSGVVDDGFWKKVIEDQYIYSKAGLLIGLVCILGGLFLFTWGITAGATSIAFKYAGLDMSVNDAAPGTILFIVGLGIIQLTRFEVTLGSGK